MTFIVTTTNTLVEIDESFASNNTVVIFFTYFL